MARIQQRGIDLRIIAVQMEASRLAEKSRDLREQSDAETYSYRRDTLRAMAIMAQRGAERLYQKARALMGLEDKRGWLYTHGY